MQKVKQVAQGLIWSAALASGVATVILAVAFVRLLVGAA